MSTIEKPIAPGTTVVIDDPAIEDDRETAGYVEPRGDRHEVLLQRNGTERRIVVANVEVVDVPEGWGQGKAPVSAPKLFPHRSR